MAVDPTKTGTPASAPAPAAPATPPATPPPAETGSDSPAPDGQAEAGSTQAFSEPILTELMETAGVKTFEELKTLVGTRIPDLMSKADQEKNRANEAVKVAVEKDETWDVWIRGLANRNFTAKQVVEALDRFKSDAKATEQSRSASKAVALELVNEAYRAGDAKFADFLQTLADDTDGKLDRAKMSRYRDTFTKLTGATASATTASPANGTATAAPATATTEPRTPPRVPGSPGGSATVPAGPAWKGGDMSRSLLAHKAK